MQLIKTQEFNNVYMLAATCAYIRALGQVLEPHSLALSSLQLGSHRHRKTPPRQHHAQRGVRQPGASAGAARCEVGEELGPWNQRSRDPWALATISRAVMLGFSARSYQRSLGSKDLWTLYYLTSTPILPISSRKRVGSTTRA